MRILNTVFSDSTKVRRARFKIYYEVYDEQNSARISYKERHWQTTNSTGRIRHLHLQWNPDLKLTTYSASAKKSVPVRPEQHIFDDFINSNYSITEEFRKAAV
jgi:hypothetical protein